MLRDPVVVVPYDPAWPEMFEREKQHLLACLPADLLGRIEHVGSTAVPRLAAKPVVDMLIEVASLEATRQRIVPILEAQGYDYFWRPLRFEGPPYYAWFIRRDDHGRRTHHLHMVESDFELWDQVLFRDYLIRCPEAAAEYAQVKCKLADEFRHDRIAYTRGKSEFVERITRLAKRTMGSSSKT